MDPEFPGGCRLVRLKPHGDSRGSLVEAWRDDWGLGAPIVQWNLVPSRQGSLRGMHAHALHDDYYLVVSGYVTVALFDLRRGSATAGRAFVLDARGSSPSGLLVPRGVAHGFLSRTASVTLYGMTRAYDAADELGCRWDDPGMGIAWPSAPLFLSDRDRSAGGLAALTSEVAARMCPGH